MIALTVTMEINKNRTLSFIDSPDADVYRIEVKDYTGNVVADDIRIRKEDIKRLARSS